MASVAGSAVKKSLWVCTTRNRRHLRNTMPKAALVNSIILKLYRSRPDKYTEQKGPNR